MKKAGPKKNSYLIWRKSISTITHSLALLFFWLCPFPFSGCHQYMSQQSSSSSSRLSSTCHTPPAWRTTLLRSGGHVNKLQAMFLRTHHLFFYTLWFSHLSKTLRSARTQLPIFNSSWGQAQHNLAADDFCELYSWGHVICVSCKFCLHQNVIPYNPFWIALSIWSRPPIVKHWPFRS